MQEPVPSMASTESKRLQQALELPGLVQGLDQPVCSSTAEGCIPRAPQSLAVVDQVSLHAPRWPACGQAQTGDVLGPSFGSANHSRVNRNNQRANAPISYCFALIKL